MIVRPTNMFSEEFLKLYDSFPAASDDPFGMTSDGKYKNFLKFQNSADPVFDRDNLVTEFKTGNNNLILKQPGKKPSRRCFRKI